MKNIMESWQRKFFIFIWILSTLGLGFYFVQGEYSFNSQATIPVLIVLLICTVAILLWLNRIPIEVKQAEIHAHSIMFYLAILLSMLVLFPLRTIVGPPLLFGLPIVALFLLIKIRLKFSRKEIIYAGLLAVIAGISGYGAGWTNFPPLTWALLQVALVFPSLLAGWGVLRHTGLLQAGIGYSQLITKGFLPALSGFARGILISIPWSLGLVILGNANYEVWIQEWWQPLIAIQPAISEEAWGRVLLIPALFLIFHRLGRTRKALTAAAIIIALWFSYLHTPGGFEGIFSTLFAMLYVLPVTYIWLKDGLETAIGFHFWLDFVKFVAAYLMYRGILPK